MASTSSHSPASLVEQGFPDLTRFFAPRSVAMLGATEDLRKFGGRCTRQLMDFGYAGEIFPVNPKRATVFGQPCYPTIADLPHAPDHVGIALPADAIAPALEACADKGVPFATVFSAGFQEGGGADGIALQRRIVDIARAGGMRLMGPNCNGLINYVDAFALTSTATINGPRRPAGEVGIVGQSGGAAQVNVMWRAQQMGLHTSYQVSCGNAADIDLLDYAGFMVESARTRVVLILAEHLADGDKLRLLARRAAALGKPLVMVKAGRTEAGARAAASHTGAITGQDAVCDAALAQLGIVRVDDYTDLYQAAMLLRRGRWPEGNGASAVSVSGGNLVLLADLGAARGIAWPGYTDETQAALGALLPGFGRAANPTDLTAGAIGQAGTFAEAAGRVLADAHVDLLVPVITMAPAAEIRSVAALSAASEKPVAILWAGGCIDEPGLTQQSLVEQGHAVYGDVTSCTTAVGAAMRYSAFRRRLARPAAPRPDGMDRDAAAALLRAATGPLSEYQSKALLRCYGLPITRETLVTSAGQAAQAAQDFAGPVALKIQSPDIAHKTEAGAVRLGVRGPDAARQAYDAVLAAALAYRPGAAIEGVLVQEMVEDAQEMLVGISHDATFGPVLTVGLGGIYVEVFKDLAFRLPPLDAAGAAEALGELRSYPLLQGVRGQPARDVDALADCIVRLSWLAFELGHLIEEMDVNPLSVLPRGRGVRIVDALVVPRTQAGLP